MALHWHLEAVLATRGMSLADLGLAGAEGWHGGEPPPDLGPTQLAALCQIIGCQPGELLSFTPETPAEQARRELASNMAYQSFLAHQASQGSPQADEP